MPAVTKVHGHEGSRSRHEPLRGHSGDGREREREATVKEMGMDRIMEMETDMNGKGEGRRGKEMGNLKDQQRLTATSPIYCTFDLYLK